MTRQCQTTIRAHIFQMFSLKIFLHSLHIPIQTCKSDCVTHITKHELQNSSYFSRQIFTKSINVPNTIYRPLLTSTFSPEQRFCFTRLLSDNRPVWIKGHKQCYVRHSHNVWCERTQHRTSPILVIPKVTHQTHHILRSSLWDSCVLPNSI